MFLDSRIENQAGEGLQTIIILSFDAAKGRNCEHLPQAYLVLDIKQEEQVGNTTAADVQNLGEGVLITFLGTYLSVCVLEDLSYENLLEKGYTCL